MADRVKGITIEFDGDTSKLNKALKDIRKQASTVDSELKSVNKLLKFNPKNTELLAQKQTLLKKKVDDSEKALEKLRNVQKQLDEKKVAKNSEEYRKVRREIIEAESKLKHYQSELRKLGNVKLTALSKQMEDLGKKTKAAGDAMTKYISGPIVAAGAASGAAFEGMAGSLAIITKLTGATGEDLEQFKVIFEDMARTVPADMDSIATAIGEVNTRFGLTGDALQDVSTMFVQFAQINGTDLITSIDGVQKAMANFGISAEDTGMVLDTLTKVSQNTGISVDRLYQGLVTNGTTFREMNLSLEQSAILMGQLEKSGVPVETVMGGISKAMKNAAKNGVPLEQELANVQEAILNAANDTDALAIAYETFGKQGAVVYEAIKAGTLDLTALADASIDASGAVEKTFEGTLTPAKQFQVVLNELKLLGYNIANSVLPYINKGLSALVSFVENVNAKWQTLAPGTQKLILGIVGAIALIGPALSVAGRIMMVFSTILTNLSTVIGLVGKALTFLAANPVVLIIAGIVALVAAFVMLWKKSEAFREFWINLWTAIKTFVVNTWNSIVSVFSSAWARIKGIWIGVASWFSGRWAAIKAVFSGVASWFGQKFADAWQAIKDKFTGWGSFWSGLWEDVKQKFVDIGTSIADAISGAVKGGINSVIELIENTINKGISLINGAIDIINKLPKVKISHINELNLPRLAEGGVLNHARAVVAGEAGPEAIIPLDKLFGQMDKMADTIAGAGQGVVINVYGSDGMSVTELAAAVERRLIAAQNRRRLAW